MYLDIYTGTPVKTEFDQQLLEILFLAVEYILSPPQEMLHKFHKFRIFVSEHLRDELHKSEVFLIRLH